jgi:hypothetical protein
VINNNNKLVNIIFLAIGAVVLLMGIMVFLVPPSIFPDPSWGFQVMRSMQKGGGFNLLISPDPANISKNISPFLSWWSPGQYLVPYFFKSIFGINSGHASALTVSLCNLSGLAGFYFFFKKIGFTNLISAFSLVFIIIQQAFWIPYAYYNGGELILFSFEGWFLYGCITLTKPDLKLVLFVFLSGLIGFICKSSFIWIHLSGLLCLWIRLSATQTTIAGWIKKGFWLGIPAVLSIAAIYVFYLSKGTNPSSEAAGFKLSYEAIGYPMASPLLAGFSVDDLLNGLIFHIKEPGYTPTEITLILSVLIIVSLLLIALLLRYIPNNNYRLFIIGFYGMSILFFSYSFLRQATISYEARHFRLIGLLIPPGLIYLVSMAKMPYKVIFLLICALLAGNCIKYIASVYKVNKGGAHGNTGLSQQLIDQPSLNYLLALDKQNTNAIFVFISADIGLEIQHNRIITVNRYYDGLGDDLTPYLGHAGPIYMLLPKDYEGTEATVMLTYFPGYNNFTHTKLSKNYILYTAK